MMTVTTMARWFLVLIVCLVVIMGCSVHSSHDHKSRSQFDVLSPGSSEDLVTLGLDLEAQEVLNAVMREHLEAVYQIVDALGKEDFLLAQELTENELGMAKHRVAMRRQMPRNFPPQYHDLAMAHHHAAEDLSKEIPSKELPRILPALARTLQACVDCHRVYKC